MNNRQRRKTRPATATYLERVALWYLERYVVGANGGSVARVRRTLEKRVRRSVDELGTDPDEGRAAIDVVLEKLTRLGYLDDKRVASARVSALRRRGKSTRAIRSALFELGIDRTTIDTALRPAEEAGDIELEAACEHVRRKRLGRDPELRERDLRRLARAGFDYGTAKRALASELAAAGDEP